tara:strand:- start:3308 stop:3472 length:165 start_codon:yes stop_codon:yes gene_type:complete
MVVYKCNPNIEYTKSISLILAANLRASNDFGSAKKALFYGFYRNVGQNFRFLVS